MFGKNKHDSFFEFFYSVEGKKLIALSELFLDQLGQQIQNGNITDLSCDYQYNTSDYLFQLIYSKRADGYIYFFAFHKKERQNVLEIVFSSSTGEFLNTISEAFYLHKNHWHSVYVVEYRLFNSLIEKMDKLVFHRYVDIDIPEELVNEILCMKEESVQEIITRAKELLRKHRPFFQKRVYANVVHTVKTLEETLPLFENPLKSQQANVKELQQMITRDLLGVIEEYIGLSDERRTQQEEKLSHYMHLFYVKALDVQENPGW